jgi:RNA polymerase sigma-70 factor (ECF subfamily)
VDTSDDKRFTRQLNANDGSELKALFDAYYRPLCVYAMHFLDSLDESEDVVQEVFMHLWERGCREVFRGSPRAYLFSSVRNNSIRRAREQSRWPRENVDEAADIADYTVENLAREREVLDRALEKLPARGRRVFTMIVLDDMAYSEVAARLGISVNTVKTHFARALKQLRGSLGVILFLMTAKIKA